MDSPSSWNVGVRLKNVINRIAPGLWGPQQSALMLWESLFIFCALPNTTTPLWFTAELGSLFSKFSPESPSVTAATAPSSVLVFPSAQPCSDVEGEVT